MNKCIRLVGRVNCEMRRDQSEAHIHLILTRSLPAILVISIHFVCALNICATNIRFVRLRGVLPKILELIIHQKYVLMERILWICVCMCVYLYLGFFYLSKEVNLNLIHSCAPPPQSKQFDLLAAFFITAAQKSVTSRTHSFNACDAHQMVPIQKHRDLPTSHA